MNAIEGKTVMAASRAGDGIEEVITIAWDDATYTEIKGPLGLEVEHFHSPEYVDSTCVEIS